MSEKENSLQNPNYVTIEVVDTGAEYGFFGKVVARSDVRGFTTAQIVTESNELLEMYDGPQYTLRYVEEV